MQRTIERERPIETGGIMPPKIRLALFAVVGTLVLGALYLAAVRGDALLADLSAIGMLLCF